jgi:hypothetical protein
MKMPVHAADDERQTMNDVMMLQTQSRRFHTFARSHCTQSCSISSQFSLLRISAGDATCQQVDNALNNEVNAVSVSLSQNATS